MGTGGASVIDLAALYADNRLPLVRLAALLVDDLAGAEDVVHDAFLALHRDPGRIRDPQAAVAYLRTSVVNGARSVLRKRGTARKYLRVGEPDSAPPADADTMLAAEHAEMLAAVRTLPQRMQEVLALRYWSGLSEAEIAAALGISRGAVKSTASRALDRLEKLMGADR